MAARRLDGLPMRELSGGLRLVEAESFGARLLGLAVLDELPERHALLLRRCRSVHTFGMRFPIDVVFLDREERVVRVARAVPPRRVLVCRGATHVLETRVGEAVRFLAAGLSRSGQAGVEAGR